MDDLRRAFGAAVRQLRMERAWTQEELAEAADLHATYVSDLERGGRSPGLVIQKRLADAFGVRVWQIFRLAEGE